MRKTVQYILLVLGIVATVYSVMIPYVELQRELDPYSSFAVDPLAYFAECWTDGYSWMTFVGTVAILVSALLLWLFRKSDSVIEPFPAVLLTGGAMLELVTFLQAWTIAEDGKYMYYAIDSGDLFLSSVLEPSISTDEVILSAWSYLDRGYAEYMWMAVLGGLMFVAGIAVWIIQKRKTPAMPETEDPTEEEEPLQVETPVVKTMEREEWRITLICTVMDIRGDYALVKYEDSGVESEVAIALLPIGIDVGDKLKYENYEFEWA